MPSQIRLKRPDLSNVCSSTRCYAVAKVTGSESGGGGHAWRHVEVRWRNVAYSAIWYHTWVGASSRCSSRLGWIGRSSLRALFQPLPVVVLQLNSATVVYCHPLILSFELGLWDWLRPTWRQNPRSCRVQQQSQERHTPRETSVSQQYSTASRSFKQSPNLRLRQRPVSVSCDNPTMSSIQFRFRRPLSSM